MGDEAPGRGRGRGPSALAQGLALLEPRHRWLLFLLGTTSFFDGYDRGILSLALRQIRHTFHLSQSGASAWIAVVFAGALPALWLTRGADRQGRRRFLIISVTGYTIATGLTALSPNMAVYAACQFTARLFLTAEGAIVWTFAAEELPAGARGLGFGWLAMNGALGTGFGAILYGGLFAPLGLSWRWMYVAGLPPLLVVGALRRNLPESRRFAAARDAGALGRRWRDVLTPDHRRWLGLVVVTTFLISLSTQASVFSLDFLQTSRHVSTSLANFMLVMAGLPGIPIMVVAGSLSDRYGRKVVGCGFTLLSISGALGFFWLPGGVPVLLPCLMLVTVGGLGAAPALSGFSTELFPTAIRGQAGASSAVARVAGDSTSLALGGVLLAATGSLPLTVTCLIGGPLVAIALVAVAFPNTHGRELEAITGETALVGLVAPSAPLPAP